MDGQRLQNATNVVAFCERKQSEQHVAYPNVRRDVIRYFHLVKLEDVDRKTSWDCKKKDGCHSMHSVASISN
jgi:hypothetical protein